MKTKRWNLRRGRYLTGFNWLPVSVITRESAVSGVFDFGGLGGHILPSNPNFYAFRRNLKVSLNGGKACLRTDKLYLRTDKVYLRNGKAYLRDGKLYFRTDELYLCPDKVYLRDGKLYLRDGKAYFRDGKSCRRPENVKAAVCFFVPGGSVFR